MAQVSLAPEPHGEAARTLIAHAADWVRKLKFRPASGAAGTLVRSELHTRRARLS